MKNTIIITNSIDFNSSIQRECLLKGANIHISKPITLENLTKKLNNIF